MAFKMKGSKFYGYGKSSPLKDYVQLKSEKNYAGNDYYSWDHIKEDHTASKPRSISASPHRTDKAEMQASLYGYHTHDKPKKEKNRPGYPQKSK
jgi:hypothetical protein